MNDPKLKVITVLFILVFLSAMPLATTSANVSVASMEALSTTAHPTIAVTNDTQLSELIAANGWSGNGTEGNPFVIEGLDIDAHGAPNAIFIGNTVQHLIIRGCLLHNTSYDLGALPSNGNCGATVYNSTNVVLEQNVCTGNGRGLALYQSTNVTVRDNHCYDNVHGIGLYYSSGNLLMGNDCTSGGNDGIHFESSSLNVVDDNLCPQNGRYGICLTGDCNSNVLANNTCANNSNAGIRVSSTCTLNSVIGNLVAENHGYGISIVSCTGNEIYGNVIRENRGATSNFNSSNVQGYDDGNNLWNSTAFGNRWGDWAGPDANGDGIVDAAYRIDGGSNYDQLPIASTFVQILQPSDGEVVSSPTVMVSGIADPDYPLTINGALVYVETDGSFSYPLSLFEGRNLIKVRSMHPLGEVNDSVNVTYVNQLRVDLEDLQDRMDDLTETLNGALDGLNAAMENITSLDADLNDTMALLSQTREWLYAVEDQLADCYDDLNLTAEEVSSLLEQVSAMRASLIELRDSLNVTDEHAVALEAALNATIADLSSAEDQLESLRSDVDDLQEDRLPLVLGMAGSIMGALALVLLILVYTRKIKLS